MMKLSVCIPSYNGLPYIKTLVDELLLSSSQDFEIVVSDDCSSDNTWNYIESIATQDARLIISRNINNLGMDKNFTKSVSLATGKYVWLCGQDDFIFNSGIDAVLAYIENNSNIDFIKMANRRVIEGESFPQAPIVGGEHYTGIGLEAYLQHSKQELPTFLPEFIIRKSLWDKVPVELYFGTHYCQVGVFLENAQNMHWCFFAGNYVNGLMPLIGWQHKPASFAKITFGAYIVLARAFSRMPWLGVTFIRQQYFSHIKQLIKALLLVRSNNIAIEPSLIKDLKIALKPIVSLSLLMHCILAAPRFVSSLILRIVQEKAA